VPLPPKRVRWKEEKVRERKKKDDYPREIILLLTFPFLTPDSLWSSGKGEGKKEEKREKVARCVPKRVHSQHGKGKRGKKKPFTYSAGRFRRMKRKKKKGPSPSSSTFTPGPISDSIVSNDNEKKGKKAVSTSSLL